MAKPKTTKVPTIKGGGSKYDSLNAGIAKLNKALASGIKGVTDSTTGKKMSGKTYFTDTGAVDKSGKKVGGGANTGISNVTNTTGVTANPKNEDMTEAGVISSQMGETQMKQYLSDGQKLEVGNGTKESPYTDAQILQLESQGIVEGSTVAGKGRLAPGGYWVNDVPPPKDTAEQPSATYIDPETGATTTTTGASAGSQEEQNKMKEKGMSLSESTTTAEDMTDPEIKKAEDEYIALEKEITSYKNKLVDLIISDADLKADLRGIRKAYDARIAEMRNITDRQVQSVKTLGYRMGMQFTGGMGGVMGGVISNAEQEGLLKIAEIEGMKESKIIEAKAAARDHNYKIYASLMEDARALSTKKAAEVANLKKAQKEQDDLIAKQKKQIENDTLVADLYHQGFTSADEIVNQLNVNADGSMNYRITLEEAEKALKVLNPPDALKGLDSDYQTYAYLQKIGDPTVAGLDYISYQRAVANAKRAPEKADKMTVAEQKQVKLDKYALALTTPGATYNTGEGEDYILGEDGYISPKAWKTFVSDAQSEGIPRKEFIESFGYLLNPEQAKNEDWEQYQISGAENELYTGVKPGE